MKIIIDYRNMNLTEINKSKLRSFILKNKIDNLEEVKNSFYRYDISDIEMQKVNLKKYREFLEKTFNEKIQTTINSEKNTITFSKERSIFS